MRIAYPVLIVAFSLVTGLMSSVVFGAGSHSGGHSRGHGHPEFGIPGKAAEASRTIEVVMGDNFFEPEEIAVLKGETIRFVIKNRGAFVHEFNIGTSHMHAEHQKEMAMMVEHGVLEADKIHRAKMRMTMGGGHTMEHDDPNSVLLEPDETAEIIWKFAKPMKLEFACNVPGHYESGMAGRINFVRKLASK